MTRLLLKLAVAALVGYCLGRADAAYGHSPLIILSLVAAVAWLTGYQTRAQR